MDILVLYYSRHGSTRALAEFVAQGIDSVAGLNARVRTVPPIAAATRTALPPVPEHGAPYAELSDLEECVGLALGSPTRFGHMAAALQHFLEGSSALWLSGALAGKPAAVFGSSHSLHGGQESTLLSMMLPLLHHGMLITGLPYTEPEITTTRSGGSPYGATHHAYEQTTVLTDEEKKLARLLGARLAGIAQQLRAGAASAPRR